MQVVNQHLSSHVYCYSTTETQYDPDTPFTMPSLSKLERAGMNIVTLLSRNISRLASCVLDENVNQQLIQQEDEPLERLIALWKSGRSNRSATWRALLETLLELNLVELSLRIEEYLSGKCIFMHANLVYQLLLSITYREVSTLWRLEVY